ncbi:MAG TPA: hypothetical protein VIP77_16140 [Jiangellaceae bacterium]
MADESTQDAYDRGAAAGRIDARLAGHDKHFESINGSLADMVREMHELTLAVQRLGDQAVSRDATVVTTAAALKDAEEARRGKAEQSWSPWEKVFAVLAALAAAVGIYLALTR